VNHDFFGILQKGQPQGIALSGKITNNFWFTTYFFYYLMLRILVPMLERTLLDISI
jgi:hypothetical protein